MEKIHLKFPFWSFEPFSYAWLLITFTPKVSIFSATADWILLPVSLPGRWYFTRALCYRTFLDFFQLKDETCPPLPLAQLEPDSPPMVTAMCANGIKIRLCTGIFFFCHHNLNKYAKKICLNCRATDTHSSKKMQTNFQKNTRKLFAATPTLTSRAKRDCATDGKTSETNTELTNHSVGSHLLYTMVNQ